MRAKTLLSVLFLISIGVAAIVFLRAMPQITGFGAEEAARDEILVATGPLPAGTLLRPQDVLWQKAKGDTERGEIVRPNVEVRELKPELDEDARAAVYGAALRKPLAGGDPIRRGEFAKPGDRDFLDIVLSPGTRAIGISVHIASAAGPNTRLLGPFPGDRVDLILTQKFEQNLAVPITRHSVGEAFVQNVRVLAFAPPDPKTLGSNNTDVVAPLTLEVTPEQAEKITVAQVLAKDGGSLAFTLRGTSAQEGIAAGSTSGSGKANGIKAVWAGDVSPALGGAMPEKVVIIDAPPVSVIHGNKTELTPNPVYHASKEGAGHGAGAGSENAAALSSSGGGSENAASSNSNNGGK